MNRSYSLLRSKFFTRVFKRNIEHEPPYLDHRALDAPEYPPLNIQIKGYDFAVLEHFGKWMHKIARHMNIEVETGWATPCTKLEVTTFQIGSSQIKNTYHLQIYERNLQISELPSTIGPIFLEVLKKALPMGVELSIHEHMEEYDTIRRIPDLHLKELRKQLEELGKNQ